MKEFYGNYLGVVIVDRETGELKEPNMRAADIVSNKEFWSNMFKNTDFAKYIENTYKISNVSMMENNDG